MLLLERKYSLALEFVSSSCQWCASSRGRKRMTNARDRWPRDTRGPISPASYSSRGESSTLHLATLVSPVQPSLQIFLKISVLPPVFLLLASAALQVKVTSSRNHVLIRQVKGRTWKGCWLVGRMKDRGDQHWLLPPACWATSSSLWHSNIPKARYGAQLFVYLFGFQCVSKP